MNTPDDFVNTESNIDNFSWPKIFIENFSLYCNNEVKQDYEDLVDFLRGLIFVKKLCVINDKW